jgi:hypothetical protein
MRRCTILGGQRDGEIVDYVGAAYYVPVTRPISAVHFAADGKLPPITPCECEVYRPRQDRDGRWWYVLEGELTAM